MKGYELGRARLRGGGNMVRVLVLVIVNAIVTAIVIVMDVVIVEVIDIVDVVMGIGECIAE
jgi:hypothetical protein